MVKCCDNNLSLLSAVIYAGQHHQSLRDNSLMVGRPNYQDLFGAEPSIIGNILKFKFKLLQSVTPGALMSSATTVDNIVVELDINLKKKRIVEVWRN